MSPLLSPNIFVVIMAGGRGTRFWPRSRHQEPKQFINIVGSESLLRTTVNRLSGLVDKDHILIITTEDLVSQTQKICRNFQLKISWSNPKDVIQAPV